MAAANRNTIAPAHHTRHAHPHAHLVPVPHLRPEWDDHGPDLEHPHTHIDDGDDPYHHHDDLGAYRAHDNVALKSDDDRADDNDS